jgi:hypothetical protein
MKQANQTTRAVFAGAQPLNSIALSAFAAVVYWRAMSLTSPGLPQAACGVTGDESNAALQSQG